MSRETSREVRDAILSAEDDSSRGLMAAMLDRLLDAHTREMAGMIDPEVEK